MKWTRERCAMSGEQWAVKSKRLESEPLKPLASSDCRLPASVFYRAPRAAVQLSVSNSFALICWSKPISVSLNFSSRSREAVCPETENWML